MTAASGKKKYVALHGGVWISNPNYSPGGDRLVLVKTGDVVELFPEDAERINKQEGILMRPYRHGHLVAVTDEKGRDTGEVKRVAASVKDTTPRLVEPSRFQTMRDQFEKAGVAGASAEEALDLQRFEDGKEVA